MKEQVTGRGMFFRTLRNCMSEAWQEADSEYHIPKSRFQRDRSQELGDGTSPDERGNSMKKYYFRRFRNCFAFAWEASDRHYHIPKSRHGGVTEKQD